LTVTAGDGVGVDDLNAGACAYGAFTDLLSDCGTGNVGGQADSAVAASYDFGNGFTVAAGIGGGGISDTETVEDLDVAVITVDTINEFIEVNLPTIRAKPHSEKIMRKSKKTKLLQQ